MQEKKKDRKILILLLLLILFGSLLILYPLFSNWYAEKHNAEIRIEFETQIEALEDSETEELLERARIYNRQLQRVAGADALKEVTVDYHDTLDLNGTGLMGYITIPKIDVELPIYHGTSEKVLAHAAGHLQSTSLPIGGKGTHAAISAHTGTANDRLFTDLNLLETEDTFTVSVLGKEMVYEIDQIKTVLPYETDSLQIDNDKDLVTLVTCTPFGVNSHRLLVRGHRVESPVLSQSAEEETSPSPSEPESRSIWVQKYWKSMWIGVSTTICAAIAIFVVCFIADAWKRKGKCRKE